MDKPPWETPPFWMALVGMVLSLIAIAAVLIGNV